MIKFVLPAVVALSISIPAAAMACNDCCPQTDCCQRQKRFEVCCVTKEVCRLKLVCVTDECGRSRRCLQRVPTTVTRKRLVRVDRGCGCNSGCQNNCGCDAGCQNGCGCGSADVHVYGDAPAYSEVPADGVPVIAAPPEPAAGE